MSRRIISDGAHNFTFPQPFRWLPGHSEQIGYVYVGASKLGEFVTWGTPTVTAAN